MNIPNPTRPNTDVPNHLRLWGRRSLPPTSYRVVIVRAATKEQAMQFSPLRQEWTPFDSVLTQQLRDGIPPGHVREILAITATEVVWQDGTTTRVAGELVQSEGVTTVGLNAAPASASEVYEHHEHDLNIDHGNPVG